MFSVGRGLAREFIGKTFCEWDRQSVCFVHHYESDWSFLTCVLQCQCSEQSRRPGHRDGHRVSPEPPQRARERACTEESSRNWAWVLSARNRWILKMQLSCHFEVITFQFLFLNNPGQTRQTCMKKNCPQGSHGASWTLARMSHQQTQIHRIAN